MSATARIFVTRRIPTKALKLLQEKCKQVDVFDSNNQIPNEKLLAILSEGVDGLFCLLTDAINKEILDASGRRLKVVSTMSVGLDHIDLKECLSRNIKVGYTPDVLTAATAEFAVSLLLSTCRRIVEGSNAVKNGLWGTWKPMWMCGPSLNGSTVGVIGLGRIGKTIVEILRSFGVKQFLYNSATQKLESEEKKLDIKYAEFNNLLSRSDFVICSCALNENTKNLFGNEQFNIMKNSAVFINISRGGTVDHDALYFALTNGKIAMAGLDVTVPEPLPPDHRLLKLQNCVITPHIGSASIQTRESMAMLAAENLIAGLNNENMPAEVVL